MSEINKYLKQVSPSLITNSIFNIINNGDGTITITEDQIFRIQDVVINTSDFTLEERTLSVPLGFSGYLRYSLYGEPIWTGAELITPSANTFYLMPTTWYIPCHVTDIALNYIQRDSTTGAIIIDGYYTPQHSFTDNNLQYIPSATGVFFVDATNGNNNNSGLSPSDALQDLETVLERCGKYSIVAIHIASGSYTVSKIWPHKHTWMFFKTGTTNPNITCTSSWFMFNWPTRLFWTDINIYCNTPNNVGILLGNGAGFASQIALSGCGIVLESAAFVTVGHSCYPQIEFTRCTITKSSIYPLVQSNAGTLNLDDCTIKDGAGNTLTPSDVVFTVKDATGTIRNFISSTIL